MDLPIVAVDTAQGPLGFVVDDIDELVSISPEQLVTYEENLSSYIKCVARLEKRQLFVLDHSKLRESAA